MSVVIPATNDPPSLARCIAAIQSSDEPPNQVIVVEDRSMGGAGGARNAGAREASGEILVFVDADVIVHPDAFTRIRAAFDADPELAGVFGSYDCSPGAPGVVSGFRNLLHHYVHQGERGPIVTFWAGLGAVRRDAFEEIGGFDPSSAVEDIELGMRLAARGGKLRLDPQIQGTHLKRWTLAEMIRTDFIIRGAPWVELMLREHRSCKSLNLGWQHRLSAVACLTALGGGLTRRRRVAATSALTFVAVNQGFYGLLLSRSGPVDAGLGVGLHAIHHLVAIASVPAGWVLYLAHQTAPRLPSAPGLAFAESEAASLRAATGTLRIAAAPA